MQAPSGSKPPKVPQPAPRLEIGDFLPTATFVDHQGRPTMLQTQDIAGHMLVLFLCRRADDPATAAELERWRDRAEALADTGAKLFAVAASAVSDNERVVEAHRLPFPLLTPTATDFLDRLALAADATASVTIVTDPNSRIVARIKPDPAAPQVERALEQCRSRAAADLPDVTAPHPPVLLVPSIFDAFFCARLIEVWQRGDKRENEVSRGVAGTADYEARSNADVKRRTDVLIPEGDNALNLQIRDRFQRRIVPELVKCFQFAVRSYEVARIGCYDAARGGYFRAHRDDVGDPKEPRRFALSLNLNDDFEGGGVRFPEYGGQPYRPPAGGGVVFSCNLLHEAMPVTRGRRFGLFTFFR
jgi:peroxiredoxin/predicted 2-oxoglutarate/Fe(II)-dependent dioxygenase YbiX